ncbi:MAG: metallophosphoesterase [Alphaproteobacteria bacterium]|nr:metallophosphoesterase [Alphaproteobacteria bacterium]
MFSALQKKETIHSDALPGGTRIYAIGDIHGELNLLEQLQEKISTDLRNNPAISNVKIIYLGDYINRGSDSRKTIDRLIANPFANIDALYLMGNHEYALIKFLAGEMSYAEWINWGGDQTLISYGMDVISPYSDKDEIEALRLNFRKTIPLSHYHFLSQLKPYQVEGDYVFVHAGMRPGVAIEDQELQDLILIRDDFLKKPVTSNKIVIHGHTIFDTPRVRKTRKGINSIGIDTGAHAKGKLTAIVLENEDYRFITAQ